MGSLQRCAEGNTYMTQLQGQKCCMKFNGSRQGFQSHSRKTHQWDFFPKCVVCVLVRLTDDCEVFTIFCSHCCAPSPPSWEKHGWNDLGIKHPLSDLGIKHPWFDPVARLGGFSIFNVFWIEHGLTPKMCRRQYIHDPMQGQKCCMKFNGSRQGFQSHSRKTHKYIYTYKYIYRLGSKNIHTLLCCGGCSKELLYYLFQMFTCSWPCVDFLCMVWPQIIPKLIPYASAENGSSDINAIFLEHFDVSIDM